jgi:hypothetical protein
MPPPPVPLMHGGGQAPLCFPYSMYASIAKPCEEQNDVSELARDVLRHWL